MPRPHCLAASRAIACQRSRFPSFPSLIFTIEREQAVGTYLVAPSSTDFWIERSMRSPFARPWYIVASNFGSFAFGCRSVIETATSAFDTEVISQTWSVRILSQRISSSPGRMRSTSERYRALSPPISQVEIPSSIFVSIKSLVMLLLLLKISTHHYTKTLKFKEAPSIIICKQYSAATIKTKNGPPEKDSPLCF